MDQLLTRRRKFATWCSIWATVSQSVEFSCQNWHVDRAGSSSNQTEVVLGLGSRRTGLGWEAIAEFTASSLGYDIGQGSGASSDQKSEIEN